MLKLGVEIRSWNKGVKYFIAPCSGAADGGADGGRKKRQRVAKNIVGGEIHQGGEDGRVLHRGGGYSESGSLHQCRACGLECRDTASLYLHVQRHESGNPAVPTCLQKMGYSQIRDFKSEFSNKLRRIRVSYFLFVFFLNKCMKVFKVFKNVPTKQSRIQCFQFNSRSLNNINKILCRYITAKSKPAVRDLPAVVRDLHLQSSMVPSSPVPAVTASSLCPRWWSWRPWRP